ncbi:MAG: hypothetical protein IJ635_10410 [Bacteroidaceae bacterium]|nr:hypothetical protein [Bacteroidaceae bacterium]
MKKSIVNGLLVLCTLGLLVACFFSIYNDIAFDEEKAAREQQVIARLLQIRDAEEQYKMTYGEYCGTIDSVIDFVKNGKTVDKIIKEGELTDDQLEAGMTEREAVAKGIIKRDTVWITAAEKLGIKNPDSLKYVPVGRKADGTIAFIKQSTFDPSVYDTVYQGIIELRKKATFNMKSNEFDMLVEFRARLDDYMDGMSEKKIKNLKADLKKRNRNRAELMLDNEDQTEGEWYGLRIGDLEDANNKMAGNWE